MSKITEALEKAPASLLEIQELNRRLDSVESAIRDLTAILKKDLSETDALLSDLEKKIEKLEKFKNMLIGALILSNVLVGLLVRFIL